MLFLGDNFVFLDYNVRIKLGTYTATFTSLFSVTIFLHSGTFTIGMMVIFQHFLYTVILIWDIRHFLQHFLYTHKQYIRNNNQFLDLKDLNIYIYQLEGIVIYINKRSKSRDVYTYVVKLFGYMGKSTH